MKRWCRLWWRAHRKRIVCGGVCACALLGAGAGYCAGSVIALGAQDVSQHESGAFTGETSGHADASLVRVIALVGHSERRQYHGETDEVVAIEGQRALAARRHPDCVCGETLAEREAGQTEDGGQAPAGCGDSHQRPLHQRDCGGLRAGLGHWHGQDCHARAGAAGACRVACAVAKQLQHSDRVHILYGGSMNAANAAQLLAQPDIDGGLVGGAALKAPDFLTIISAAARIEA
jgi:triosephosphate isomerase